MKKNVLSLDAESDGLWGNPFAVAATLTTAEGNDVASFAMRLNDAVVSNEWARQNVLPHIQDIPVSHIEGYETLLREFAAFYMANKTGAVVIAHNPCPVEAHLFRECHRIGAIGDWDAPYPLIDLNGLLDLAGEDPTLGGSCGRQYILDHGLEMPTGSDDNPLFDCRAATVIYRHLKGW